mmetsp:Transcript_49502/g.105846  ORF Transcript_49502/g.105846 Transcript_49502/m.105846 type:complete len:363 (+) Transcript_49502:67-1155(+)
MAAVAGTHAVTLPDVQAAAARLEGRVHRTPVVRNATLDGLAGRELLFKCELMQKTGSFKARGACNAAMKLPETTRAVVTHSSGNHAAALAWAAKATEREAHIVMPSNAPAIKRSAVEGYGATITLCEPTNEAREREAEKVCQATGGALVHPSNDPNVIAGQGTVGLELVEQGLETWPADGASMRGGLDCIVVPIGGGGLTGGVSVAAKGLSGGKIVVVAAEPELADDACRSKAEGSIQGHKDGGSPDTIADGLKTLLGSNTFPLIRDCVDDIITVSEADIAAATRLVWERIKLAIEPSAGVGVAAVLSHAFRERHGACRRVGVVLCGGNCDVPKVAGILSNAPALPSGCCADEPEAKRQRVS